MNIAALVKAVPGADRPAMDALSRRAVAQAVELAAAVGDGVCTAFSLGPHDAEDVVREAMAWGRICSVMTFGVHLTGPQVDAADNLFGARAIAEALRRDGPFDLVLLGARAEDGGCGLLGPQVAELLDLPFVEGARYLSMQGNRAHVRAEHDDGWLQATVELPAVVSCAAGLIDPCEVSKVARELVPRDRIRIMATEDVGLDPPAPASGAVAVVADPARPDHTAALIAAAAGYTSDPNDQVVVLAPAATDAADVQPEDAARVVTDWAQETPVSALLAPDTSWGREVAGRVGVRLATMALINLVDPRAASVMSREPAPTSVTTVPVRRRNRVRVASRTRRPD